MSPFMCLADDEDEEEVMEMARDCKSGWMKITAAVDSAAADNAMPEYLVPRVRTKETAQSRAGKVYRGAGGETIP